VRFRFTAAEKVHHSLNRLCRCLRVTRSGFSAWQRRPESARAKRDRQLKVLIHTAFAACNSGMGARGFTAIYSSRRSASVGSA
jgi:hypothetical protein